MVADDPKPDEIRESVRNYYASIASSEAVGCGCETTPSCCGSSTKDISEKMGYSIDEVRSIPQGANMGLGCGNPQAIASLKVGETVLDLGSGGGFDCFLAAWQVGKTGSVIGVDFTPEMIHKARKNADSCGYTNVEFRLGEIEHLPMADSSIDVIMSNCVINLSPDKESVYREAFRVLKPGGRLAIADVVATEVVPDSIRNDMKVWSSCASGAMVIEELESLLEGVGFHDIKIVPIEESKKLISEWAQGSESADIFVSSNITAIKPVCSCCHSTV